MGLLVGDTTRFVDDDGDGQLLLLDANDGDDNDLVNLGWDDVECDDGASLSSSHFDDDDDDVVGDDDSTLTTTMTSSAFVPLVARASSLVSSLPFVVVFVFVLVSRSSSPIIIL